MFDINSLTNMVIEGANSTQIVPVPEGEYTATIIGLDAREITRQDGTTAPILSVTWQVNGVELPGSNQVRQDIWLDMTPAGTLDMSEGKNIALGRLRAAVGQNRPGVRWTFGNLMGQSARILVTHRRTDDGEVFAQVKRVTSL
jgi:hypothetical protein